MQELLLDVCTSGSSGPFRIGTYMPGANTAAVPCFGSPAGMWMVAVTATPTTFGSFTMQVG